jgi:hypothetical protein
MLAIVSNDKLEALNQYMMKQIKNRFGNSTKYKRFNIGVDREHQRLYQLSSSNSGKIDEDGGNGEPRRSNSGRTKEETERLEISAKHGSEAYKSAYSSGFSRQFGPRKTKFDGLKIE